MSVVSDDIGRQWNRVKEVLKYFYFGLSRSSRASLFRPDTGLFTFSNIYDRKRLFWSAHWPSSSTANAYFRLANYFAGRLTSSHAKCRILMKQFLHVMICLFINCDTTSAACAHWSNTSRGSMTTFLSGFKR